MKNLLKSISFFALSLSCFAQGGRVVGGPGTITTAPVINTDSVSNIVYGVATPIIADLTSQKADTNSPTIYTPTLVGNTILSSGSYIGNGSGLTNLPAASFTAAGTITSNQHTILNLQPDRSVRPPLRFWNSWVQTSVNVTEWEVLSRATNMVSWGFAELDYGLMVDEYWCAGFDTAGNPIVNSNKFPRGMKYVADTVHGLGMQFGLICVLGDYGVDGVSTNRGFLTNLERSATNVANWGVDFVYTVIDDNGYGGARNWELHKRFLASLQGAGKTIQILSCVQQTNEWQSWMLNNGSAGMLPSWPSYGDSPASMAEIMRAFDHFQLVFTDKIRPGAYPYMSFWGGALDTAGNHSQRLYETRAAMNAIWHGVIAVAEIYETHMYRTIQTNRLMLDVQADSGAHPPKLVATNDSIQVWSTRLGGWTDNKRAVVFLNRDTNLVSHSASISWTNLGLPFGTYTVNDVWSGASYDSTTNALGVTITNLQCGFFTIKPSTTAAAVAGVSSNSIVLTEFHHNRTDSTAIATDDFANYWGSGNCFMVPKIVTGQQFKGATFTIPNGQILGTNLTFEVLWLTQTNTAYCSWNRFSWTTNSPTAMTAGIVSGDIWFTNSTDMTSGTYALTWVTNSIGITGTNITGMINLGAGSVTSTNAAYIVRVIFKSR